MLSNGVFGGPSSELSYGNRRATHLRVIASAMAMVYTWWCAPRHAFAKGPTPPKPYSLLDKTGLTQTPDAKLRQKIEAREKVEAAKKEASRPHVTILSDKALSELRGGQSFIETPNSPKETIVQTPTGAPPSGGSNGSGTGVALRNPYFAGTMPWHKSFRDVNLCTGNLFKNFTDIQVAPGKGQGLALSRTYNSNENRIGAFGMGWTHAYDIRMEDAGVDADGTEYSPRTDFFGGKHSYTRDVDGLYTPPPYLFDELDSNYHAFLSGNFAGVDEDKQVGQDGTVKHFISEGVYAAGHPKAGFSVPSRVCDYIEDRHGNRTNLVYTTVNLLGGVPKKLLSTVTDPTGRQLVFGWANLGTTGAPAWRITGVTSPKYAVAYGYNAEKNLASVTLDPTGLNRTTTYGYTSAGDGNGNVESGLLNSITDPLGHAVTYSYGLGWTDNYGYSHSTPTGTIWVLGIQEPSSNGQTQNWILRQGSPLGGPQSPGGAFLSAVVGNSGHVVACDVDYKLRAINTYADYMSINDINLTYLEHKSVIYEVNYDDSNNIVSGINRYHLLGAGWTGQMYYTRFSSTYGPHGNVLTQQSSGSTGTATTEYFDASKYFQKKKVTDPAGRVTEFDYYPKAKNTATPNDPITKGRDGQAMWIRDPGYSNGNSTSYQRQFEYDYNQFGQKVWEKNLAGVVTTFEYADSWGNLTKVRQDPTGLNRTTQMIYDNVGNVLSSTDPKGQSSSFNYNNLGQPTSAVFPASGSVPGETISYSYGANGRTQSVTDGRGTTSMTYEAGNDRLASVTDPVTGTMSYTYGIGGERKTMTLPGGGTITYDYVNGSGFNGHTTGGAWSGPVLSKGDPNSVMPGLTRIIDDQGRFVDMLMSDSGMLHAYRSNMTFNGSGTLVSYSETWNVLEMDGNPIVPGSSGRVKETNTYFYKYDTTNPSNPHWTSKLLSKNVLGYNPQTGQKTTNAITDSFNNSRTETYGYDELSRLKTVNYGDGQNQGYSFDSMGNRLSKTDNVTGSESYVYNNANMLLTRNGQSYSNDANGNTLLGGGRSMVWDSQNRMVQCIAGTGNAQKTSSFTYGRDGLRRRMTVVSSSGNPTYSTDYVLDGQNVVQESVTTAGNVNPVVAATYLMGPSGPLYKRPANSTDVRWYLYDGGGNVTGEVDVAGNVTASEKHDVYGAMRGGSGTAISKHGWQGGVGHQSDSETGLVYMRARYYAPELGRFQSEDSSKAGMNWFGYCVGDPVNFLDENGKWHTHIWEVGGIKFQVNNDAWAIAGLAFLIASLFSLKAGIAKSKLPHDSWGNLRAGGYFGLSGGLATIAAGCFAMAAIGITDHNILSLVGVGMTFLSGAITSMTAFAKNAAGTAAGTAVMAALAYGVLVAGFTIAADAIEMS